MPKIGIFFPLEKLVQTSPSLQKCKAKGGKREERIESDIRKGSGDYRGYILSCMITQPQMEQRSDVLISLIDGLEAYNSLQRDNDREHGRGREELK